VSSFGMLLLILDAKTALQGATEGMNLCIRSIIPSLFPFFLMSVLLTDALTGIHFPFLRPLGKICGIPKGSESLLAVGLLGGYPVGAQCVAQAYKTGQLSRHDAGRMLGFCSNAGPAFLFGMVAAKFSSFGMAWILWGIHILSALAVGAILPGKSDCSVQLRSERQETLSGALRRSIGVMAGVCGWVILFRVILSFLEHWFFWLIPEWAQVILSGLLELANGCCSLDGITNEGLRLITASAVLGFGGVCVSMQTLSVTEGLGMGWYFPGKLLQTFFSLILATIFQASFFPEDHRLPILPACILLTMLILCIFVIILWKLQKSIAFRKQLVYNSGR